MPKLTAKVREQIAPFLVSMSERGMGYGAIRETLCGIKPLSRQAIRKIIKEYQSRKVVSAKNK